MNIAISGASGFIASHLIPFLKKKGYGIVPLFREDFEKEGVLSQKLKNCNGIINLAGEPIVKRWSEKYKKRLYQSRVDLTKQIANTLKKEKIKPKFFISASAVGIYKDEKICDETCRFFREDFLGTLCKEWEKAAFELRDYTRTVVFRIGVVIGKNGGIIKKVSLPFKLGLGGRLGSGKQGFSWIHIEDLCWAILFAIENETIDGVLNAVSPNPVDNLEFTKTLAKVLKRPAIFPVPSIALKLMFGEGATVLLEGQKVVPKKLSNAGFTFNYPELSSALKQVFSK